MTDPTPAVALTPERRVKFAVERLRDLATATNKSLREDIWMVTDALAAAEGDRDEARAALARVAAALSVLNGWRERSAEAAHVIDSIAAAVSVNCPCHCPADMHIGEIGCPCGLPDEPPCAPQPLWSGPPGPEDECDQRKGGE